MSYNIGKVILDEFGLYKLIDIQTKKLYQIESKVLAEYLYDKKERVSYGTNKDGIVDLVLPLTDMSQDPLWD